jgi:hypothetical protein
MAQHNFRAPLTPSLSHDGETALCDADIAKQVAICVSTRRGAFGGARDLVSAKHYRPCHAHVAQQHGHARVSRGSMTAEHRTLIVPRR